MPVASRVNREHEPGRGRRSPRALGSRGSRLSSGLSAACAGPQLRHPTRISTLSSRFPAFMTPRRLEGPWRPAASARPARRDAPHAAAKEEAAIRDRELDRGMPRRPSRSEQAAPRTGRRRAAAQVSPAQRVAVDPARIALAGRRTAGNRRTARSLSGLRSRLARPRRPRFGETWNRGSSLRFWHTGSRAAEAGCCRRG
jgi:hypothetical protein